jgi:hypothetical protein
MPDSYIRRRREKKRIRTMNKVLYKNNIPHKWWWKMYYSDIPEDHSIALSVINYNMKRELMTKFEISFTNKELKKEY